ncbi:MAG: hypothetical protein ABGW84_13095 [Sphingomonadaceae bacterium]|jgi:hypothetical protein
MSFWTAAVIIAVIIGVVQLYKAKHGIISDRSGNERYIEKRDPEAQREIAELRERIRVLERIATDDTEAKRLANEIDELRKD